MQRMWFIENKEEEDIKRLEATSKGTSINVTSEDISSTMKDLKRDWVFRVQVLGLEKNECLYVVGNLPELGAWNHNQAIQMFQEHNAQDASLLFDSKNNTTECYSNDKPTEAGDNIYHEIDKRQTFSQKVALPVDADVDYRYFIAVICQSNGTKNSAKTLIIRKWETHMISRHIKKNVPSNFVNDTLPDPEIFGCHNGYCKVERGWLTDETVIQFKIFDNPIKLWKHRLQNRKVNIKMTPVNLVRQHSLELQQFGNECIDDSLSMDTQDIIDQPAFSITEIAVMNDEEAHFKCQEQFGRAYKEDECIIFNVAVRYPETVAYLVDYYVYSSRTFPGEPPNHIGFSYILPSTLQSSVGILTVPITSTKHRPIGQLTVEYVVIKSIPNYPWDMSISYAKHWEQRWSGLDVGHRGLGTSFKFETKNCANVRENTIASLKTAAYHGADMVEFDVQLSKDYVPVIYHDFYVSISLKRKKQIEAMDTLEIPVKDLTLEQLHLLKDLYYPGDSLGKVLYFVDKSEQGVNQLVYHVAEGREKIPRFFDEDLEDHQPFPTLQSVLLELEPHVGCNIEIKWTMQLKDGTFELNHPFDLNMYLDTILKVVLEYGDDRKIVFSSFNPDICAMIRLKQNKYPVVFLTQGITSKYPTYHDPRCQTVPMAIRHALAADILGINVHTEDILRDPSQVKLVKDAGLIIFCWGDDNNDKDTIRHLKKLGLHAVIYDKIDVYNSKDVKESIFLVDARESQKALIALAQSSQTANTTQNTISGGPINMDYSNEKEYLLNLEKTRNLLSTSTATSVSCLNNKSNTSGDSISTIKVPSSCQSSENNDISEITKDFSVCAKSFGHTNNTRNISDIMSGGQTTALPEAYGEDESAKDCL
ncbi:glycerophosphocholine phosphodiesterase GPCPD1-like isoform X2 [Vespa mandarinia]|uniref:glycerophosphocholine phosphodiesterase GPCPD1-like isoform X2 n=1 Tax=Vespa mandarinia TaxID=7446 RepID=UPI001608E338|nr:glycerophosphocholine phosphodiesterase GPCPD1-like isoform X2 [Vespa mandarinia]